MKKIIVFLCLMCILHGITKANNVQISNVSVINGGPGNIQIKFDLTWDNSWRVNTGPANYDGVWVFFKYKTASGNWTHIILNGSNVIPAGFDTYQSTNFQKPGAMIFRDASNMGVGTVSVSNIILGAVNTLPYDIDIKGFALEMVYVPAAGTSSANRPFLGDGDGTNESIAAFHSPNNTATSNPILLVSSDGNGSDDGELITDGIYVFSNDTIQTNNPLGPLDPFPTFKSFWSMKYELSQAGYRDFLNTLTLAQQTTRTAMHLQVLQAPVH